MILKCPGQDDRNLKAEIAKCPDCGCKAEIFSDESKINPPTSPGLKDGVFGLG